MAYTTLTLVSNALYVGNIVARQFETPSGTQTHDGLNNLNQIIADQTVMQGMIPYYQQHDFPAVIGQEKYFIENLIDIDTFVFFIDSVRYSTQPMGRIRYFGTPRANSINSLPYQWHLERELGGASIYIYFTPDVNYPLQIWGQFRLEPVTINQDLSLTFDVFYLNYLEYALADRLCQFYQIDTPARVTNRLAEYIKNINKKSGPLDLGLQKQSTLQRSAGINYGDINIGHGYRPGP